MPRTKIEKLWLGGGALVAVLIAVIGYFFLISPQRARTAQVQTQVSDSQLQAVTLQSRIISLTSEQQKLASYRAALSRARAALPTAGDPSANTALLRSLQLAAHKSAVTILSLTVGDPAAIAPVTPVATGTASSSAAPSTSAAATTASSATAATPTSDLYSVDITAGVSGSTKGLVTFLANVQYKLPRVVFISAVTLGAPGTPGTSGAGAETMNITMSAFERPSSTPAVSAGATGSTPAGADTP